MALPNEKADEVGTTVYHPRFIGRPRLVRTGLLLSSALLLSTLLPLPWSSVSPAVLSNALHEPSALSTDPSEGWKDDVWPIREQTPWDISTDFPFPRSLEYDVTEGTWLRLDVHPKTGDIVFDILGDIYCLPANAYSEASLGSSETRSRAVPVLLGVPHDSDPHFSPEGDRLVFRSDAELGVENIWIKEWKGCEASDIRPSLAANEQLSHALQLKEEEEDLLASGVKENAERKHRRLLREGRLDAQRVTNETYRWVSDARFHPSGKKVIATKWYTSSRSLGAGEGWEYPVPSVSKKSQSIKAGSGKRLVGRTLPPGWGPERYEDQQIGPEQFIWNGNDTLIYAKNTVDDGAWTYSKDVHKGINAIYSVNLTSQRTTTLVDAFPGGASRPELSRDGRTLAFVRRVRDKEALVLKDLESGTIRNIWYGLTYDLSVVSAPMGAYPSFAFTPNDDAIIIWAAGHIYRVPLSTNAAGERIAGGKPKAISFVAHIEKRLAETRTAQTDIKRIQTADTQRVYAFEELRADESGETVIFQGAGATYIQKVGEESKPQRVPTLYPDAPYYSPSFVPGSSELILHARWSDVNFTSFELANVTSGTAYALTGLPLGRYYSPVLCSCKGRTRQIAFLKTDGDALTGNIVATAGEGLYLGELILPSGSDADADKSSRVAVKNVRFVRSEIDTDNVVHTQLRFLEGNKKLLVQEPKRAFVIDLAAGPNEFGDYPHGTVASGRMSQELAIPPSGSLKGKTPAAIVDFFHVYYAPSVKANDVIWSKPGNATKGLVRLSVDGGHSITWSGDGSKLFWFLGPWLHYVDVSELSWCSKAAGRDTTTFGIECAKRFPKYQELVVEYPSDVHRLKKEAAAFSEEKYGEEAAPHADFFVIANATLLTMETGDLKTDVLHDAVLVTRNGEIEAIVGVHDVAIPYGATVLDAQGGFVVPGFIDVHAHWTSPETHPSRNWQLEAFLAYGVTTLHNPSTDTVLTFTERFRTERGQLVGPRIFHTGTIIYGGGEPEYHQDIVDLEEAKSALLRIKVEGGPSSFSYKNYNLPSRASRQRLLLAARNLSMLCVPEGGMNFDWDQTYIVDGMTTIEHALPIPVLYDDVLTLYALSGTGSTPTHVVNYGGVMGEQYIWAHEDLPNNDKLRRFMRHDLLESLSETTSRPLDSFQVFNTSISTAKMVRKGLKAHIGAHGEIPLGFNYHAEMFFTKAGGLTNYEVLRAATSDAAVTLGIDSSVGSLTPGKLADFVVYPPGVDLLEGDIKSTKDIRFVVRGGRVWDASTLTEIWPVPGRREPLPPLNAD
ncbi:hypothetical protein C8Q77DRAFT_1155282 [Trametes polyzona]|nr:hypothetical protein C8Q77DRAFT_1155282 [Trametes polyzona]